MLKGHMNRHTGQLLRVPCGFGDIVPKTFLSRLITFILIFCGIAFSAICRRDEFNLHTAETRIEDFQPQASERQVSCDTKITQALGIKTARSKYYEVDDIENGH